MMLLGRIHAGPVERCNAKEKVVVPRLPLEKLRPWAGLLKQPEAAPVSVSFQLHSSIKDHNIDAVRQLLRSDADANCRDGFGITALMLSASLCNSGPPLQIFKLLLEHRADVNCRDQQQATALMHCVADNWNCSKEVNVYGRTTAAMFARGDIGVARTNSLRLLLAVASNVDAQDHHGLTALMLAACTGRARMVAILLDAGAAVEQRDDHGWSAVTWAANEGWMNCVEILIDAGALKVFHEEDLDVWSSLLEDAQFRGDLHEDRIASLSYVLARAK